MQTFQCEECAHLLFFENTSCIRCGHRLGYFPDDGDLLTLKPVKKSKPSPEVYYDISEDHDPTEYRLCANSAKYNACNWLIPAAEPHDHCLSCRLTDVLPPLQDEERRRQWVRVESAKRRLIYTLLSLGLPVRTRQDDPKLGLAFRLEEPSKDHPVLTGHASGIITLNMLEANAAFRENTREKMGEVYRTVLGHLRHESGHYYWELLVLSSAKWLPKVREVFGDDRLDYKEALDMHYKKGAPADWDLHFVSSYATMHPWEDWAETWAHYLHMVDTLETAESYDLTVRSPSTQGVPRRSRPSLRDRRDFDKLFDGWYSLTFVLNGLSRSMGMPDSYPFSISESVKEKLRLVHDIVSDFSEAIPVEAA